ncbi:MAG: hypothetical protein J5922_00110 [Clostridia bacterium]|nr:hypothetical protein [Clostridia bacterium]
MKKIAVLLVLSTVLSFGLFFSQKTLGAWEEDTAILVFNDTVYEDSGYYPARNFSKLWYVPLAYIDTIEGLHVKKIMGKALGSFIISTDDNSKYMSYNVDNNGVMCADGTSYAVATTIYSKQRYIPLVDIIDYFGFDMEFSADMHYLRLSNGKQKKTLDSIRNEWEKKNSESTSTVPSKETNPTDDKTPKKGVYLGFCGSIGDNTDELLDLFSANGGFATFFVGNENVSPNAEYLLRMITGGHSVGFTVNADDFDGSGEIVEYLDKKNAELFSLLRITTRLVNLDGTGDNKDDAKDLLESCGYTVCDFNIESRDETTDSWDNAPMIEEKFGASDFPLVKMGVNDCAVATARILCKDISADGKLRLDAIKDTSFCK